ncbi:adenosine 5'-monophosphoramidase HINT3-like isoform X1 [Mercenaria mercenaria]|uniref:adenosine 5'-monophosphoramidase HINT3-like isoform X1 n=1 Tax=Mercenaria mercenaria TaxID=6596 RepID=UPI00234E6BEE|nr:adenosine 5'-monophosphoramidase HINT3-like isoform X1 [Mercenaria mercenaria]
MTEVDGCIFCKIAGGNDEKTEILHRDDTLVVFRDIRPATSHHYLVVTTEHISDAKQLKFENLGLVERMVEVGKDVVQKQGGDIIDLRSIVKQGLQLVLITLDISYDGVHRHEGMREKKLVSLNAEHQARELPVDWVIDRLKKMKPKDTHSNSGT